MRKATVTKRGDSGHWFMIGEVIMEERIEEDGTHQFVNEDGKRQWLLPEEFEYAEKGAPTKNKFEKGDLVVINDLDAIEDGHCVLFEDDITEVLLIDNTYPRGMYVARTRNIDDFSVIRSKLLRNSEGEEVEAFFIDVSEYDALEVL